MGALVRTRWAAVGAATAVTLGAGGLAMTQAAPVASGDKAVFVPIEPCRLIDTRGAVGPRATPLDVGEALPLQVTGSTGECADIPADARAAALNVTAIQGSTQSFLTVYPGDAATRPNASNLNWRGGDAPTPNKVDVRLGAAGDIRVFNSAGTVHVAVDLVGYYRDHVHDDRYYTEGEVDTALGEVDTALAAVDGELAGVGADIAALDAQVAGLEAATAPEPRQIVVPAAAFRPVDGAVVAQAGDASGAYPTGGSGGIWLRAPLLLPVGSRITSVTYHFLDISMGNLTFEITSASLTTDTLGPVTDTSYTSSSASLDAQSVSLSLNHVVAADEQLTIGAFNEAWATANSTLVVKGATIGYVEP